MVISKVCRLAWEYPVRGLSTYGLQPVFVNLSEQQVKQGYQVHVVAARKGAQPKEETCNGVSIHRVPVPFNLNAMREVNRLTKDDGEWVVHTHATCGIFTVPMKKLGRIRLVSHSHGTSRSHHVPIRFKSGALIMDYSTTGITYDMLREKSLWRSADRVLTVSRTLLNDIRDSYGVPESRLRVVYNGADTDLFRPDGSSELPPALRSLEGKKIILYVGHFGLRKGIVFLIRAMRIVQKEVPDSHLVCIGGVPEWLGGEDYWGLLRREIEDNGVSERVTLMDKVRNVDLPDYYRAASVFALPSYYETISKVTMEAMACGIPVIATNTGGIPEVVDDGTTGILVPYASVEALASALSTLLNDDRMSRRMGTMGRAKVERVFTWQAVAQRVKSVYDELQ
ncbi:MAG TPA: glycosyltransferase family 4 protein [Nitrososphaerales archaeon]|nr:glycosyltransferase family 4 protein [Nitrososphaerales archaeon]